MQLIDFFLNLTSFKKDTLKYNQKILYHEL